MTEFSVSSTNILVLSETLYSTLLAVTTGKHSSDMDYNVSHAYFFKSYE